MIANKCKPISDALYDDHVKIEILAEFKYEGGIIKIVRVPGGNVSFKRILEVGSFGWSEISGGLTS